MAHLQGTLFDWRKLERHEVSCPLCPGRESRVYEKYGEQYQYSLVECLSCGLVRQSPVFRYDQDFLAWAYDSYGESFRADPSAMAASQKKNRGYFGRKKALIRRFMSRRPFTLLDVGAAGGEFLYACRCADCEVSGVEVSAGQAEFARTEFELDVWTGTAQDLVGRRRFDVIHCAHTLEHLPDPKAAMEVFKRLLNPGGIIFIEVPNLVSLHNYVRHLRWRVRLLKNAWRPGDFPEHLVEFTPVTLRSLFEAVGLEIVYFEVHSRSALNRSMAECRLNIALNRILAVDNNLICIGRVNTEH